MPTAKPNPPPRDLYRRLFEAWGPQGWWPGRTRIEVMVGAVLTQNTAWTNVVPAIANLRRAGRLTYRGLLSCPEETLADLIRPAGTYRIKARRLKALVGWLEDRCGGRFDRLFDRPTAELREALLSVPGIGPETADCILLYAGGHPVMVIDAYTRRVMTRHRWCTPATRDEDLADALHAGIRSRTRAERVRRLNEFHALLVRLGKEHCRTKPLCHGCPLEPLLPAGGPA